MEHSKYYYDYNRNDPLRKSPFVTGLVEEDVIDFKFKDEETKLNIDKNSKYKYNEESIVNELLDYIRGTYGQHYAANDQNIQTLDFIEASHGDGESFARDNILKYTSRYDKKGTARRDIMKILHYAVLLMYFNDKNAQRETYPQ